MELGFIIITVVLTLAGIVAGFRIGYTAASRRASKGVVYVSMSSGATSPSLYLELDVPADVITNEKYVTFEVCKTR